MFGFSNNLSETITRVVKYVLVFCVIYLLLRVVPKTPLCLRDNFIISLIITAVYVLYDVYICNKKEHLEDTTQLNNQLSSLLNKINTSNPELAASLSNLKTQVTSSVQQQMPQLQQQVQQQVQQMQQQVQQMQQPPQMPEVQECTTCQAPSTQDLKNNQDVKMIVNENNYNGYRYTPVRKYPYNGSRMEDGILASEMSYTDYNSIPLGQNLDTMEQDFSYTFLPPDRWYPVPPHPPVCVAEKECPVCPVIVVNSSGNNADITNLKEWNNATRITPGDQINTNYINDKINSGR